MEVSKQAVQLLRSATTGPYPPSDTKNPPLNFQLDVETDQPTPEQMATIRQYLDPSSPRPGPSNYPIIVDWFGGKAFAGQSSMDGASKILEELQKERDASFAGRARKWKFW